MYYNISISWKWSIDVVWFNLYNTISATRSTWLSFLCSLIKYKLLSFYFFSQIIFSYFLLFSLLRKEANHLAFLSSFSLPIARQIISRNLTKASFLPLLASDIPNWRNKPRKLDKLTLLRFIKLSKSTYLETFWVRRIVPHWMFLNLTDHLSSKKQ